MRFHADSTRNIRRFHASRIRAHRAVPGPLPLLGTNLLVISGPRRSFQPQRAATNAGSRDHARSVAPWGPEQAMGVWDAD
jgi:hypothetical protein